MIKCDFCTEYNPKTKECYWELSYQASKRPYCKKAIAMMTQAISKEKDKNND